MSKSLNNVRLLKDALAHFPGEVVRLALLMTHYRQPLNWTEKLLFDAKAILDRWYRLIDQSTKCTAASSPPKTVLAALKDDLNTPAAITAIHALATHSHRDSFVAGANLLGLLKQNPNQWFQQASSKKEKTLSPQNIEDLIRQRQSARERRDFSTADAIRQSLSEAGIVLEDTAQQTTWRRQ